MKQHTVSCEINQKVLSNMSKKTNVSAETIVRALGVTILFRIEPSALTIILSETIGISLKKYIEFIPDETFENLIYRLNTLSFYETDLLEHSNRVLSDEREPYSTGINHFVYFYSIKADENWLAITVPQNLNENEYHCFEEVMTDILFAFNKGELFACVYKKLPENQYNIRKFINNTKVERKDQLLYSEFVESVKKYPDKIALYWQENDVSKSMTYSQLKEKAFFLRDHLCNLGIKKGDKVIISMPKGRDQIIAVLAVLFCGAVYVPVGFKYPEKRKISICKQSEAVCVLLNEKSYELFPRLEGIKCIDIHKLEKNVPNYGIRPSDVDDIAYIIFTSGTTGEPKGIEIPHSAAWNTIEDVIKRLSITSKDIGIAVSELDFDLSVFDIFGVLSIGGSLVLVQEHEKKEAAIWCQLVSKYKVTLWNSVPALLEMLLISDADGEKIYSLQTIIVSGDWVRPKLYYMAEKKIAKFNFVAMGGATEASIWSNYFIVDKVCDEWSSIPYGVPLSNQSFRIVDEFGRECVDYQDGELQIAGKSLAKGYVNNPKLTAEKFIYDEGKRWYVTGDLARYLSDGSIEFRGRIDNQVKLRGYRIELEEITRAIQNYDGINQTVSFMLNINNKDTIAAVISLLSSPYDMNNLKNIDEENNADNQTIHVIKSILYLDELFDSYSEITDGDICIKISLEQNNDALFNLWMNWLVNNKVLEKTETGYIKGQNYDLENKIENADLQARFINNVQLYRDIISGKKSPLMILDQAFPLLRDRIADYACRRTEKINIGVYGVGEGILTNKLLQNIDVDTEITLFDGSLSMLHKAKAILENADRVNTIYHFAVLPVEFTPQKFWGKFDVVLSLNTLYTVPQIEAGIKVMKHLLKEQGEAIILESRGISPLSIITSAVNPVLNRNQWNTVWRNEGFRNIEKTIVPDTLFDILVYQKKKPDFKAENLKTAISHVLPEYMSPEIIEVFYHMPLNRNGKVDRKQVKDILQRERTEETVNAENGTGDFTKLENVIRQEWKKLLFVDQIDKEQSFFEAGGDSLLATRFITIIKEKYLVDLTLGEMFDHTKIKDIAALIESKTVAESDDIELGEI